MTSSYQEDVEGRILGVIFFPGKEKVLSEEYSFLSYHMENGCVVRVVVIVAAILEIEGMTKRTAEMPMLVQSCNITELPNHILVNHFHTLVK